ncbi:MAG: HPr family phosphocarrier protein [Lachnospiraceae bacterium]|nr:HPr family phosphocarrier protein [Lachnospiraceae bacterium]
MREVKVVLATIERVKEFVSITNSFDIDFDLVCGRYIIDAKSILGIFSIDLSKPVLLRIHAKQDEAEEILELLKDYIVG